jgi:hypothetical protein
VQQGDQTFEQWFPPAGKCQSPQRRGPIQVSFGWKQYQLPIGLELLDFEVQRNEGSDTPAGFKSTGARDESRRPAR